MSPSSHALSSNRPTHVRVQRDQKACASVPFCVPVPTCHPGSTGVLFRTVCVRRNTLSGAPELLNGGQGARSDREPCVRGCASLALSLFGHTPLCGRGSSLNCTAGDTRSAQVLPPGCDSLVLVPEPGHLTTTINFTKRNGRPGVCSYASRIYLQE